jgi:hypothetical protein
MIAPWPSVFTIFALRAGSGVGVFVGSGTGVAVGGAGVGVGGMTTVGFCATAGGEAGLVGCPAGRALVGGGAADVGFACTTTVGLGLTIGDATDQTTSPPRTSNAAATTGAAKITACLAGDWS